MIEILRDRVIVYLGFPDGFPGSLTEFLDYITSEILRHHHPDMVEIRGDAPSKVIALLAANLTRYFSTIAVDGTVVYVSDPYAPFDVGDQI